MIVWVIVRDILSFLVALVVVVTAHEWGHYRMAVACGVKVLRFSIGFGKPLLRWKSRNKHAQRQQTEFVLAAIPLGGYVRMVDEREGEVAPEDLPYAFNRQKLYKRALIVVAGPVANLILAALLYSMVNWIGQPTPRAILAPPEQHSLAQEVGIKGGEIVVSAAKGKDGFTPIATFDDLRWILTGAIMEHQDVQLIIKPFSSQDGDGNPGSEITLAISTLAGMEPNDQAFERVGISHPLALPILGEVIPGGSADRAGLLKGDLVRQFGDNSITDSGQLTDLIRAQVENGRGKTAPMLIERKGQLITVHITPDVVKDGGQQVGRISIKFGARPKIQMITVRMGPLDGLINGVVRVYQISILTMRVISRMITGQYSIKNLSSSVAIADFAGQAFQLGFVFSLSFIAFLSVSLGLMNLLPVPVLDGGHLAFYAWEAVTKKPVEGKTLMRLQMLGLAILLTLMAVTLYNDISMRLFG